jgi:hypothetical protein
VLGFANKSLRMNFRALLNLQSGFAATPGGKAMPYRESCLTDFEAAPLILLRQSLKKKG